mmetsp:Transcript_19663/g.35464  ORF Transcript_19663/g.35464 Transcript_19663/m.35464 type:complete len:158 (-) Transcript_19663:276-749(-)
MRSLFTSSNKGTKAEVDQLQTHNEELRREIDQLKSSIAQLRNQNTNIVSECQEREIEIKLQTDIQDKFRARKDTLALSVQEKESSIEDTEKLINDAEEKIGRLQNRTEIENQKLSQALRESELWRKKSDHLQQGLILLSNVVDDLQQNKEKNLISSS